MLPALVVTRTAPIVVVPESTLPTAMQEVGPGQEIAEREVGPDTARCSSVHEDPPSEVASITAVEGAAGLVSWPAGGSPTAQQRSGEPQATAVRVAEPAGAGAPTTPIAGADRTGRETSVTERVAQPAAAAPAPTTTTMAAADRRITGSGRADALSSQHVRAPRGDNSTAGRSRARASGDPMVPGASSTLSPVDVVDIVLVVLAVAAAVHGLRLGALAQILTFAGFLGGLALGLVLAVNLAPHVHSSAMRAAVTLACVLVPAIVLGAGGRMLGAWSHDAVGRIHLGTADSVLGVVVAVGTLLVSAWLVASLLAQTQLSWLSSQIQRSDVLKAVQKVMPPEPGLLARAQGYLDDSGFPTVFADLGAPNAGPVPVLSTSASNAVGAKVSPSMVKVLGQACGYLQEGSGFVVAPGLVVTNAHVVAGEPSTQVQVAGGTYAATPIYYDPRFDLAVLRTPAPLGPPLSIDPSLVTRGTKAAVLGFPEDGPLVIGPAGVAANLTAVGHDIYNQGTVVRDVYQIDADVEPGNSGGPLGTPSGTVIGVVFSRSTVTTGVGYALASPGVLQRVKDAERGSGAAVSTEGCTEG